MGFVPFEVLHKQSKLHGIQIDVVCGLWCVGVTSAVKVFWEIQMDIQQK